MRPNRLIIALLILGMADSVCFGQSNAVHGNPDTLVTRKEYERVLQELDDLKVQLEANEEQTGTAANESQQVIEELDTELRDIKSLTTSALSGNTKALITGYASAGYSDPNGENGTFGSGFNPILLWKLDDRLFFEGELELEFAGSQESEGGTELELEFANISYIANDYLTFKAGKFLSPFGTFSERLHPAWINKLPDAPLPFGHDGIAPTSDIGLQASGGTQLGQTKINYSIYLSNGPRLNSGEDEPEEAGMLHFDNNVDIDDNKAIGTRIGFLPLPQLEAGYSFQSARVSDEMDARANLHAADMAYVGDSRALKGTIDVRAQWVWSIVDDVTYETAEGAFTFDNKRDGGYVQFAYRPSKVNPMWLGNFEALARWDKINRPNEAPMAVDEERWTIGFDYWFAPSTMLKAAYQWGKRRNPMSGEENVDALLIQAAMGF